MNDIINGAFEFCGALICLLHVFALMRDRKWRGVSWAPFVFFSTWGWWNLYYYPSVNCMCSFYAATLLAAVNTYYCYLLWLYRNN